MAPGVAVVLLNLGGPDSLAAVEPFLVNLFSDPDIFRFPLARLTQPWLARRIAHRRAPEAAKGYAAIGGRSPLLANTRRQAEALEAALRDDGAFRVYVCMRYWHPLTDAVVAELRTRAHDTVVLLPLYPQYSATTTGSAQREFQRQCERQDYRPRTVLVDPWYDEPEYHEAILETLRAEARAFPDPRPEAIELLLSAHGLPQRLVAEGDPYAAQVRATYDALRAGLGWPHTTLCFQSRVGPLKWLAPYTDAVIRAKADGGARQILVYPIAFVSDHIETLYELGIQYAELARRCGVTHYRVAPALNDDPRLIRVLRRLVLAATRS